MSAIPAWRPHWDVWALLVILAFGYWFAERRIRPHLGAAPASRRQRLAWYGGLAVMWVASDWPVHDIAEETLFTFHMVEHMLIGYVVPPLLLLGMPRWMADLTLGHPRVAPLLRPLAHPVSAFFLFNSAIILVHWPQLVAVQNSNELAHFLIHVGLFATGVLLWLPVFTPTPALRALSRPMRMLYLFANTILPTIPAAFLTFGRTPLYPMYGDGPAAWGITQLDDQTIAGIVMKLAGGFYLLGIIAVMWFRWIREERSFDAIERELVRSRR